MGMEPFMELSSTRGRAELSDGQRTAGACLTQRLPRSTGPGLRRSPGPALVTDLNFTRVRAVLHALNNPGQRRVLILVRDEERAAGEIAAEFTVTWPAVSHHLRVLKDAGLLTERRKESRRLDRTRPEGLAGVRVFFDQFPG